MKRLNSILAATAAAALAACIAGATSASTITETDPTPISGPSILSFAAILYPGDSGNIYDFDFSTTTSLNTLLAAQAQLAANGGNSPIQFELDEQSGAGWTELHKSLFTTLPPLRVYAAGRWRLSTANRSDRHSVERERILDGSVALFTVESTAVPEPATWAMLIVGLGLVGFAARRRRDASAAVAGPPRPRAEGRPRHGAADFVRGR
jgi:hypothetical protein